MVMRIFVNVEELFSKCAWFAPPSSATVWVMLEDAALTLAEAVVVGAFPPGTLLDELLPAVIGVEVYLIWYAMIGFTIGEMSCGDNVRANDEDIAGNWL
jgi:hypothetical protein